jgi:hypothetical protein
MTGRPPKVSIPPAHSDVRGPAAPDEERLNKPTGPHWELSTDQSGLMTAVLTGLYPPIVVTAYDLDGLRKKVQIIIMRGML